MFEWIYKCVDFEINTQTKQHFLSAFFLFQKKYIFTEKIKKRKKNENKRKAKKAHCTKYYNEHVIHLLKML